MRTDLEHLKNHNIEPDEAQWIEGPGEEILAAMKEAREEYGIELLKYISTKRIEIREFDGKTEIVIPDGVEPSSIGKKRVIPKFKYLTIKRFISMFNAHLAEEAQKKTN